MKKILVFIFLFLFCFSFALTIHAHPGRTDKNGGHVNRATGGYHYHHGYEAHSHINGICPFDFDDKTGQNSGPSSSSSSSSSLPSPAETFEETFARDLPVINRYNDTESELPETKKEHSDGTDAILFCGYGALIIFALFTVAISFIARRYESQPKPKPEVENFRITPIVKQKEYETTTHTSNSSASSYKSTETSIPRTECTEPRTETAEPKTKTPDPTAETPPKPPPRPLKKNANKAFPLYAKDHKDRCYMLKFQYHENLCLYGSSVEKLEGKEGCIIRFKQEPENTYDKWAVAVYLGDERVGYIYRGEVQRLTNGWINKGNKVVGFINSVGFPYGTVTYKIGFYSQIPYIPNDFTE